MQMHPAGDIFLSIGITDCGDVTDIEIIREDDYR